ncbi:MAG: hypothetical protein BZY87_09425 [SAR202 cluster bacterium Io17-Chloro-G6]|nr:MAG: hypothetical protein BZY87_09425 [SAR202 cluster bacterium Io17-Chloro-G6]
MSSYRWGPEGPPPEAYSRVTNPERFAGLHEFADALLNRLEAEFAVQRAEDYGLDPEMESVELARPSVRLTPDDADAAPILFTFTAFPGIAARFGCWYWRTFPSCGCDACDESAEGEFERLESSIDDVIAGRFREEIRLPFFGKAFQTLELWSPSGRSGGPLRLNRSKARQLLAGSDRSLYEWKPWPVR